MQSVLYGFFCPRSCLHFWPIATLHFLQSSSLSAKDRLDANFDRISSLISSILEESMWAAVVRDVAVLGGGMSCWGTARFARGGVE